METIEFQGKLYTLNQVQEDLFEFTDNSKPGEYTDITVKSCFTQRIASLLRMQMT